MTHKTQQVQSNGSIYFANEAKLFENCSGEFLLSIGVNKFSVLFQLPQFHLWIISESINVPFISINSSGKSSLSLFVPLFQFSDFGSLFSFLFFLRFAEQASRCWGN